MALNRSPRRGETLSRGIPVEVDLRPLLAVKTGAAVGGARPGVSRALEQLSVHVVARRRTGIGRRTHYGDVSVSTRNAQVNQYMKRVPAV